MPQDMIIEPVKAGENNLLANSNPPFSGCICASWSEVLKQEVVARETSCYGVGELSYT